MAIKETRGLKRVIQSVAGIFAEPAPQAGLSNTVNYKKPAAVSSLTTGLRPLDKALGVGGLPHGKITELIGLSSNAMSGGTTCIAARIAAKTQSRQKIVSIMDMAHAIDPWQAERCGLIAPQLLLTQPDTLFKAITAIEQAARNADLIIINLGVVKELLNNAEPQTLKMLLQRLRKISKSSDSAFLMITLALHNDPFSPANYPTGFPLSELADIRLWTQEETWSHKFGLAAAYKANLAVIKNELAIAGKGANITIKLAGV